MRGRWDLGVRDGTAFGVLNWYTIKQGIEKKTSERTPRESKLNIGEKLELGVILVGSRTFIFPKKSGKNKK